GYVLDGKPLPFYVAEHHKQEDYVVVEFGNVPQLGNATIFKTGDMVTKAEVEKTQFGDRHKLGYEQKGLEGVTFDVIAQEDIVTNDGTVRAKKGDVVDTVKTGKGGKVTTKDLHLGKYAFVETKAPNGYVIDKTPVPFELQYAGQDIEVTNLEGISAYNYLQSLLVHTHKVEEQVVWKEYEPEVVEEEVTEEAVRS